MVDFERHGHLEAFDFPPVYEAEEAQEGADSEEEVVEISEEALMRELDSIEAPLQVCWLRRMLSHPGLLAAMASMQSADPRSHACGDACVPLPGVREAVQGPGGRLPASEAPDQQPSGGVPREGVRTRLEQHHLRYKPGMLLHA